MLSKNIFKSKIVTLGVAMITAFGTVTAISFSPASSSLESGFSISASADSAQAYTNLKNAVKHGGTTASNQKQAVDVKKTYMTEGGGTVKYENLVKSATQDGVVDETLFGELTDDSKKEFLTDINKAADTAVNAKEKGYLGVTEQTKDNWLKQLQATPGIGSKLMDSILQNTSPDFVTANRIYEPFSGVLGTVLALLAILIMAFLGITMALDLAYLAIPAFRLALEGDGDGKGGTGNKPKLISSEAFFAMQQAEGQGGQGGQDGAGKKVAVGIYFKKRVIMLIALGICLLYLVSGQIYTLVSWILDLVSGFLGF